MTVSRILNYIRQIDDPHQGLFQRNAREKWEVLKVFVEMLAESPPAPTAQQAPAQADEYPALVCDYCGALTPDPWHSSGMLHGKMSKHIHSCDACCRGAAQAAPAYKDSTPELHIDDALRLILSTFLPNTARHVAARGGDALACLRELTEVASGNELITTEVVTELLTEGAQGPPGPPGSGAGGGIEQSIYVDASRPIAYVAYANRIVRLDYATWPPAETTATTANVHADWPNRATLGYA